MSWLTTIEGNKDQTLESVERIESKIQVTIIDLLH